MQGREEAGRDDREDEARHWQMMWEKFCIDCISDGSHCGECFYDEGMNEPSDYEDEENEGIDS